MRSRGITHRWVALAAALALLTAACAGGADGAPAAVSTPLPGDAGTSTAAPAATPATAAEVTVATRADGLTGAPVPRIEAASRAVEEDRVFTGVGRFPPLDFPSVVPAAEATWLGDGDLVLGAVQNGEARAYPLSMMTFHHVANDELGGEPYLVTF